MRNRKRQQYASIGLGIVLCAVLSVGQVSGETAASDVPHTGVGVLAQTRPVPSMRPSSSSVAPPRVITIPFIRLMGGDPTKAAVIIRNMKGPMEPSILIGQDLYANFAVPRHTADSASGQKIYVHVMGASDPPRYGSGGAEFRLQFVFPVLQLKGYYKNYSPDGDNEIPDIQIQNASIDIFLQPSVGPKWRPTFGQVRVLFSGQVTEPEHCLTLVDVLYPVNVCDVMKEAYGYMKKHIENGIREALQQREVRLKFDQAAWAQVEREIGSQQQIRVVSAVFRGTDFMIQYYP